MEFATETRGTSQATLIDFLLEEGCITPVQLERARKVHARLEVKKRLSEVLIQLGYIYEKQIREVMKKHKKHLRLGDFLLEMSFITEEALDTALKIQRKDGSKRLGEVLIEQGFINDFKLCQALGDQIECPYVEPDLKLISQVLFKRAPEKYLRSKLFLPFTETPEGITVIFADPLDTTAVAAAREIYGDRIIPAIAPKAAIVNAIDDIVSGRLAAAKNLSSVPTGQDEIVKIVDYLIHSAIEDDVSDIHIEPLANKLRVRYRKDGILIQKTDFPRHLQDKLLSRVKVMAGADIADKRHHQDGKITYHYYGQDFDIRFSSYVTVFGENIVLRILSMRQGLKDLIELGMEQGTMKKYLEEVLEPTSGVVIITGPTGSGKTTTLYSSIDYCNKPSTKIITAEDPVEYIIEGIVQCSINTQIGLTYTETLKAMVRQDPDIIVLGEIRDKLSADVAIQAALTGHKVFSTFHTEDSIGGIIRLIDMDIETFLISSTVLSIVAQRLVRKVCSYCREPYTPDHQLLARMGISQADLGGHTFYRGSGCKHCNFTGYSGRVGLYELLLLNEPVKNTILEKRTAYEIRRVSFETTGLVTLLEDGINKVVQGLTTFEEVRRQVPYTAKPRNIEQLTKLTEK